MTLPLRSARRTFFLPHAGGQRLAVFHAPQGPCRGRVLYLPPLAEEMNKARRMAALQAEAFSQAGFAVLGLDLLGCGDSSGDFGDASWSAWLDDLMLGHEWLRREADAPQGQDWLWGLRAGCLLAAALATRLGAPTRHLYWQPPASGRVLLQQFLRLKSVGDLLEGGDRSGGGVEALKRALQAGDPVEVAGYRLSPGLALGLDAATLAPPAQAQQLLALELSNRDGATPSPLTQKLVASWQQAGCDARCELVAGAAFWQTTEIEDAPALLTATLRALAPEAAHA
ncbi:hydrolase 2, exosortase A system-associated [Inhella sp.]|uniref:hydrolase 2, exosortase A system-associated n=1 Tax=Inhella sp. TaxID=1921806 RepID=UPI0035B08A94